MNLSRCPFCLTEYFAAFAGFFLWNHLGWESTSRKVALAVKWRFLRSFKTAGVCKFYSFVVSCHHHLQSVGSLLSVIGLVKLISINWIHPGQNAMMVQKALAFSQLITSAAKLSDQCEFDWGPRSPKAISSQKRPHSTHQSRAWLVTQLSVELFNSSQTGILTAFNPPSLSSVNWIFIENQCYTNHLLQNQRRWEGSYVGLASYPSTPMVQQLMQQWNLNRMRLSKVSPPFNSFGPN